MGCPTEQLSDMIWCVKYEKTIQEITLAHREYYVCLNILHSMLEYAYKIYLVGRKG